MFPRVKLFDNICKKTIYRLTIAQTQSQISARTVEVVEVVLLRSGIAGHGCKNARKKWKWKSR